MQWVPNEKKDRIDKFLQGEDYRVMYLKVRDELAELQQRTWVGLTDQEIKSEAKYFCNGWYLENPERLVLLVKTIQAKLREKNT